MSTEAVGSLVPDKAKNGFAVAIDIGSCGRSRRRNEAEETGQRPKRVESPSEECWIKHARILPFCPRNSRDTLRQSLRFERRQQGSKRVHVPAINIIVKTDPVTGPNRREGGEIDNEHVDRFLQRHDGPFTGADGLPNLQLVPVRIRSEHVVGEFDRFLEPDTAVAVIAIRIFEEMFLGRVVEVDGVVVGKTTFPLLLTTW